MMIICIAHNRPVYESRRILPPFFAAIPTANGCFHETPSAFVRNHVRTAYSLYPLPLHKSSFFAASNTLSGISHFCRLAAMTTSHDFTVAKMASHDAGRQTDK